MYLVTATFYFFTVLVDEENEEAEDEEGEPHADIEDTTPRKGTVIDK